MTDHNEDTQNLFDQDDALDYIIYNEMQKEDTQVDTEKQYRIEPERKSGCLGLVILLLVPLPVMQWLVSYI